MAREVLSGRRRLRDMAGSDVYGEALFKNYASFWKRIERLPEDERRRLMESSAKALAKLRAGLEEERKQA
jgi:dihydroneopterin aldolase